MLKDLKFCDVKDNYVLMHMDIFLLYIRNGGVYGNGSGEQIL